MNIAIVGAGSAGIATAYALALDSHAVTVYESHRSAAEEASFAPAGWLLPALWLPWAAPGMATRLQSQAAPGRHALLRLGRSVSRRELGWALAWRRAGKQLRRAFTARPPLATQEAATGPGPAGFGAAFIALLELETLARYSATLRQRHWQAWQYDPESVKGSLLLFSSTAELDALSGLLVALRQSGLEIEQLDAAQTRQREPGLSEETPLAGSLFAPAGLAANGRLATLVQRQAAQHAGVRFVHGQAVRRLQAATAGRQAELLLSGESTGRAHDAIVVCTGPLADVLLTPLGVRLPSVQLAGYTVSAPLRDETRMPRHAIVDWNEQLSIVPQGLRLRLGAGAELGTRAQQHPATLERMFHRINALFPGSCQLQGGVQVWRGSRSCTSDGLPIVGPSGKAGIWLNLAHGACGNSLAEGCAQLLVDLLAARTPGANAQALAPERFQ